MTVQVDTAGPGIEAWRSGKFAATVQASTAYVYGYTRDAQFDCTAWSAGDSLEQSFLSIGADEASTVVVTLVSGDAITSATVYPKDAGVTQAIASGELTLTVPPNVRARVEVNGVRSEVLSVFTAPVSEAPGVFTNASTLVYEITGVATGDSGGNLTITAHGLGAAGTIFRCTLSSTGTLPVEANGTVEAHEALIGVVIDADNIQVVDTASNVIKWTGAGSGTITMVLGAWASGTLYFGAGVHNIGRLFDLASSTTVFIDRGAVVIGSFDLDDVTGVTIEGPGTIAGTYADPVAVQQLGGFDVKKVYSVFYSPGGAANIEEDNLVSGVTVIASPFFLHSFGVRCFRNVHHISPWSWNTDGFGPAASAASGLVSEVRDCYAFAGDDCMKIATRWRGMEVSDSFFVCTSNGVFGHFSIPLSADNGYAVSVTDCHAMTFNIADSGNVTGANGGSIGSRMIWKAITDGFADQQSQGHYNVTIVNLKVWAEVQCRLFVLGNYPNPFNGNGAAYASRDLYGEVSNVTLRRVWVEEMPGQVSLITGLNALNTPHDIEVFGMEVAGVAVTTANAATYFDVSPVVYNIAWEEFLAVESSFIVETGTGATNSNSYATIAFADFYFQQRGNPAAWSNASLAGKEDALRQASFYLKDMYGRSWRGSQVSATQGLPWPRNSVTDGDTGFSYTSAEIPLSLQEAVCAIAVRVLSGVVLRPDIGAGDDNVTASSFSVGGLSINDTFSGQQSARPRFPEVESKLRGLLRSVPGGVFVRVTR